MDNRGILFLAVVVSIVMSFGSYWWSDKIVLFMNKAHALDPQQNKEIYRLVENLCITAGLAVPKIYIIQTDSMNAFATGRNPEHAVIALTTGLVNKLERTELEGVIAHELSHIGNRDILLGMVVVVLAGFVTILADIFLRWSFFGRGRRDNSGQLGLIVTVAALVLSILAPIAATAIKLAISRKREFLADADGALLTRYPEGLARALEKISRDPNPLPVVNKTTAHLFIDDPLKKKKVGLLTKLFMTHPPVTERIAALRGME
ncbi:M48 family metallopeptidase [Patescibacteria group bacterium]|nr:M48 family metallopeptidase [Patescibacteria group bacterium]